MNEWWEAAAGIAVLAAIGLLIYRTMQSEREAEQKDWQGRWRGE